MLNVAPQLEADNMSNVISDRTLKITYILHYVAVANRLIYSFSFLQSCSGVKVIWRADGQDRGVVWHSVQTGGHLWRNHQGESLSSDWITYNTGSLLLSVWLLFAGFVCVCALQKWASADLNGKFKLPMKNEFIPTNFEIYPLEKDSSSVPALIKASVFSQLLCHPSAVTLYYLMAQSMLYYIFLQISVSLSYVNKLLLLCDCDIKPLILLLHTCQDERN